MHLQMFGQNISVASKLVSKCDFLLNRFLKRPLSSFFSFLLNLLVNIWLT